MIEAVLVLLAAVAANTVLVMLIGNPFPIPLLDCALLVEFQRADDAKRAAEGQLLHLQASPVSGSHSSNPTKEGE